MRVKHTDAAALSARKRAEVLREETSSKGHCIRCLLQDYDEEAYISKLLRVIRMMKPSEKAGDETVEKRLETCRSCSRLDRGTCLACGCYVELRAHMRGGRCPYKLWNI